MHLAFRSLFRSIDLRIGQEMALAGPQIASFYQDAKQMGTPAPMRVQMQQEGIDHPSNFVDFHRDKLKQLAENLCLPGGCVPNPDPGAAGTIPTSGIVLGAMSQMKLLAAADIIRHCDAVGQPLTAATLQ